ncbi:hypothetical protein [Deinococcus sp. Arct2-2]|nr:hypothetical protein [Deinococcus sp. Arct2-2]
MTVLILSTVLLSPSRLSSPVAAASVQPAHAPSTPAQVAQAQAA